MSGTRTIGLTTLSLATLACASLGAQDRPPAFGIQCGGFGRPAVEIVVADSSAARGGATSIGTTEVRASVTDGLRLSIGASRPVPVTVRSAGGRELARATFQPGSPDVELRWEAAR